MAGALYLIQWLIIPGLLALGSGPGTIAGAGSRSEGSPGPVAYEMTEVSLVGANPWTMQLNAQVTPYMGLAPEPGVKAYPRFTSARPAYGRVVFDPDPLHDTLLTYYFALDESKGTGSGYDRFCLDANYDRDLTNDTVVAPNAWPIVQQRGIRRTFFGPVAVDFRYLGSHDVFKQQVLASLTGTGNSVSVAFAVPMLHQGRIWLGGRSMDASLMQVPTVTGRFDRAGTTLCLANGVWKPLCQPRLVDGRLYTFSATANGDQLYVSPYAGAWGVLRSGSGDRHGLRIEEGMVRSNVAIFDLNDFKCQGGWRIPVGNYRPSRRIIVRAGAVRATLGPYRDPCDVDGPSRPAVFFMKVREDRPCVLDLDSQPQIVFQCPQSGRPVKAGQELRIVAAVYDPVKDFQVLSLDDTLRTETIERPGMKPYKRPVRLDPVVVITDATKTVVARGTMPFG